WLALLLTGWMSLAGLSQALRAEAVPVALASFGQKSFEHQYKEAKDYFVRLKQDSALGRGRGNWLQGARNFRKIHLAQKNGPLGPSSLYMLGKLYQQMYERFHVPIDLENAIAAFNDLASFYPVNSIADDALFSVAECLHLRAGKENEAKAVLRKIIQKYPKGDQYTKALARLRRPLEPIAATPAVIQVQKAATIPAAVSLSTTDTGLPPSNLAQITPIKHWSSANYTRIVIEASAPVDYAPTLLEKTGDQSRRLFLDFSQSYIPPEFRNPIPIDNGLLKQSRLAQFSSDTVRVVLDINSLSDYKVFSLNDPFRVVIDVHGSRRAPVRVAQQESDANVSRPPSPAVRTMVAQPKAKNDQTIIVLSKQKKTSFGLVSMPRVAPSGKGELSLAQQLGLGVRKIVIDPGHGGSDPGAMAFGLKEKDIVLKVAQKVAKILEKTQRYEVALTRSKDVYLPLEERTAIANTLNGDLFISIHVNAHPDKTIGGVETYFLNLATNAEAMRVAALENATSTHNISELQGILTDLMRNSKIDESSRLARFVQANLATGMNKQYNSRNLGVKQAPLYVLIGAEMPAILAEISFITNPKEAELLREESYLDRIAEQIVAGIVEYIEHNQTVALKY
ncbi:MAG: N-acetylmuramoyl-L-alanine amidase, partial [Desulfobulbus sp.]|nr:N-acetylmuramoyl-L-alanine amidase [Desulfobulbus sp.]